MLETLGAVVSSNCVGGMMVQDGDRDLLLAQSMAKPLTSMPVSSV